MQTASAKGSVVYFEAIDSTNDHAKLLARDGAAEGTIVHAARQTAGRGRQGNTWESAEGNLFMSLILRPQLPAPLVGQLSFLVAVALAETVRDILPAAPVALKWPNDVLLAGRKMAGILLETEASGHRPAWVVAGIGVNVKSAPENAASLAGYGAEITAAEVMQKLAAKIMALYALWKDKGFAPVRAAWMQQAAYLNEDINVRLPNETFRARFLGIDEDGALLAETPDGQRRHIASGEVFAA